MIFTRSKPSVLLGLILLLLANESSLATDKIQIQTKLLRNNVIEHNGHRLVLYGVVVPASTLKCFNGNKMWPCGASATLRLHELLQQDALICNLLESDQTQQFARCRLADLDIARQLVLEGWALAAAGVDEYHAAEKSAKNLSVGLWKDNFSPPEDWRNYPSLQYDLVEDLLCSTCATRRQ